MISKQELEKDFELKQQALMALYNGFQKRVKELEAEQDQLLKELSAESQEK